MKRPSLLLPVAMGLLTACVHQPFEGGVLPEIRKELQQSAAATAAPKRGPDAAVEQALIPPLRVELPRVDGRSLEPRIDITLSEQPARDVFMSIVSGSRYSMLVHPNVDGKISLSLKDVTVPEALEAIRELYGYEYSIAGTRISIHPNTMQTRVFKVNYLPGRRTGRSDVNVTAAGFSSSGGGSGASGGGASTGGSPAGGGTSVSTNVSSQVSTSIASDFWTVLADTMKVLVESGNSAGAGGTAAPSTGAAPSPSAGAAGGPTGAANAGLTSAAGITASGASYTINPQAGVIVVRAMPAVLRQIEDYLKAVRVSVERQVMLEAKILEVTLRDGYQSGINWTKFRNIFGGALSFGPGSTLTNELPNFKSLGNFGFSFSAPNDFSAFFAFLEAQGSVQVLSSPRISALNNQKAVLKVGTDELFIVGLQGGSQTTGTGTTTGQTTTLPTVITQPFFSGVALDITPQLDGEGNVTLHVHPVVTSVVQTNRDFRLGDTIGNVSIPTPKVTVSETDSIVKVADGHTVAIGGLMKIDSIEGRGGVPGLQDLPITGYAFGARERSHVKKELVILIRPTVVSGETNTVDASQARERFGELDRTMKQRAASDREAR